MPDEDIVKDCRSCCADDDKVTYVKARIKFASESSSTTPSSAGFVENKAGAYDKLEVVYRQGQKPRLVLVDEEGDVGESCPSAAGRRTRSSSTWTRSARRQRRRRTARPAGGPRSMTARLPTRTRARPSSGFLRLFFKFMIYHYY